jgi:hypothetical protein
MKINREELYTHYMKWVDQVTEECDWKTSFGIEEILESIATILENNPHLYISNKEQIINEAYENYRKTILTEFFENTKELRKWATVEGPGGYNKEMFINKCKTDSEFSEKWGLKIEERELSLEERSIIAGSNHNEVSQNIKMFTGIDEDHTLHKNLHDNNIPTKLITITYKDTKIESYE